MQIHTNLHTLQKLQTFLLIILRYVDHHRAKQRLLYLPLCPATGVDVWRSVKKLQSVNADLVKMPTLLIQSRVESTNIK